MKTRLNTGITSFALCAAASAVLTACGGGNSTSTGDDSSGPPTATQITGKAIDGYLAGATVCLDDGAGACDTSQPTATTDASGNYSLTVSGDVGGKTIDVVITSQTTDTTNGNTAFNNGLTLSAVLQGNATQNVTPITSMVAAQMKKGLSFQDATASVKAIVGNGVDPGTDYVAAGDSKTASFASQVVSAMQNYAANGAVTPDMGRDVLNAIVAAGSPGAITPAGVLAQANAVASPVDASVALAQPLHVVNDFLTGVSPTITGDKSAVPTSMNLILRDTYTLSGPNLAVTQEQRPYPDGNWTQVAPAGVWDVYRDTGLDVTLLDGSAGVFEMKADGSWTDFLPDAQLHLPIALTSTGSALSGTDPDTGIGYTLQYRQRDISGQPIATAVPFNYSLAGENPAAALMTGVFASGTKEYLGSASWSSDQVILPVDVDTALTSISGSNTTLDYGEGLTINGNAIDDPNNLGTVGQTYASVQQAIGLPLTIGAGGKLVLNADGTFTVTGLPVYRTYPPVLPKPGSLQSAPLSTTTTNITGTWTPYPRNANVLVLTLSTTFNQAIYTQDNVTEAILSGAKFVIALHNGRLKSGFLIPAGTVRITPQFTDPVADQIASALLATGSKLIQQP